MSKSNSSLRPGWFKGSGAGGGKGFQPPPTASDRGDKGRSNSTGSGGDNESGSRKDSNIFAALLDDDDGTGSGVGDGNGIVHASESSSNPPPVINSSRSEAFRSSFNRASSTGSRRSLADLAARVPESAPALGSHGSRRHTSHNTAFDGPKGGAGGSGRFSHVHSHDGGSTGGHGGSIESYKPDPKVVRYTREKLLSLRFAPRGEDPGPPDELKPLEGSVVISATVQDPVCWDTFDAEEIWEMAREQRRAAAVTAGKPIGALEGGGEQRSRRPAPSSGRWSRGLALPPPEEGNRRKGDADNPNELWDDPVGGVTGAASDFSSFGALPPEDGVGGGGGGGGDAFDFDKMTEASAKLEKELHGNKESDSEEEQNAKKMVDVSRPLASAGTTLVSGSGNGVNVFEDFDAPNVSDKEGETRATGDKKEVTTVRGGDEDPSASSRLMQMIGVSRDPANDQANKNAEPSSNPWGSSASANGGPNNTTTSDPIIGGNAGGASISLNPWGDPIVPASASSQQTAGSGGGMNLGGIHLRPFSAEEKNLEAQRLAEREKIARQEAEMLARRRQEEEEGKRRALAQQQQAPPQQSQIELVLMERICTILENSWGRNDLVSILTTLHTEDSRVVPLLGNIDALRALIARSPQRVNLRRDPGLAGEMAVLVMTNTQWQEQQQIQARIQQEELRRRQLEEEAKARLQAQNQLAASIKKDAPWFYSDPQNNIQGPFRGEEMRQWLEAGYFKGDLPISQVPSGPFHQLSNWFPDLSAAFVVKEAGGQDDADIAVVKDQQRKDAEAAANAERQRLAEVVEVQRKAKAAALAEAEARKSAEEAAAARALESTNVAEMQAPVNGGNQSSAQLKLMLGLSSGEQPATENKIPEAVDGTKAAKKANAKSSKTSSKKVLQKTVDKSQGAPQPEQEAQPIVSEPVPPPIPAAPAAPAWGGIAKSKPRKSMSEIQQEEARAAAALAAKRGNMPQPSSSGWANVAAGSTGSTGWSTTAIRSSSVQNAAPVTTVRPGQAPSKPQTKKVATSIQHACSAPASSSTPAEEFGATMSPALEKWCKEKMQQINGSNDLTLVAFCMTLNDASEIRQYLTTYLGSTMQVNNFATEFINKRGLGSKQEEWETPGSAKKGRKKKSGR